MNQDIDFKNKKVIIISGPSGVGKNTIIKSLLKSDLPIEKVITSTDRKMRRGEVDGAYYRFFSPELFQEKIKSGEMIEYELNHVNFYGTTRTDLMRAIESGQNPLFDIDIKGGLKWKKNFPDKVVTIFIAAESEVELENRIRSRRDQHTTEDQIATRLETAKREFQMADQYDYQVVNRQGQIKECIDEITQIIKDNIQ